MTTGAANQTALVNQVFVNFECLDATRADDVPLTYYAAWGTTSFTTQSLLRTTDGQCIAWTRLLIDVLRADGVNVTYAGNMKGIQIAPDPDNPTAPTNFLVGNWDFGNQNVPPALVNNALN
jgi:hypothetical protein